jgi:hypothetical protein
MRSPFVPYRNVSRTSSGRSSQATSMSTSHFSAMAWVICS